MECCLKIWMASLYKSGVLTAVKMGNFVCCFVNYTYQAISQQRPYQKCHNYFERKFIIAKLSIRKLGSLTVLITDEDPSLRIESFAIINLHGVSTKLN